MTGQEIVQVWIRRTSQSKWQMGVTRRIRYLPVVIVLIAFTGCSHRNPEATAPAPQHAVDKSASQIRLLDLDNKSVDLQQECQGRVHVVVFTRSDCPISNRMAPEIRELCRRFESQGVDFHLIYVDPDEKVEAIRAHLREYEYPCPALRDMGHALAAQVEAEVTPEAVVFDGNWKITYRGRINDLFEDFGKMRDKPSKNDLHDAIAATLAGHPIAEPVTKAVGCYIRDLK
jgi:hypothetical protein